MLRAPLSVKLAGANLIIVLAAWTAGYIAHRHGGSDWRVLAVMTVAVAFGLAVNLLLMSVALRPIRDLERTAMRVWAGDLDSRVPRSAVADSDLAQIGGTLNFLLGALAQDRARVRALASEVVRAGDRERSRVGKELHDSVAQSLAAIRYQLTAIEREATDAALIEQMRAVRESAGELLEQVRLLSHTVHPQILDDLGLVPALRHLVRTATAVPAVSITVDGDSEPKLREIPSDVAAALYRVAQQSISNAVHHAKARTIVLRIGLADGVVSMQVDDDGIGFDPEKAERDGQAMGLFTMRQRIALVNGEVEIRSTLKQGTSVCIRVPVVSATARGANQLEIHHAR